MDESDENHAQPEPIATLLDTSDLAGALESDRFKQFLDHLPVAIAVSEFQPSERIVYSNVEFERISRRASHEIVGKSWHVITGIRQENTKNYLLGDAIVEGVDFIGTFSIGSETDPSHTVDAWSNIIEDDNGSPSFRLVALTERFSPGEFERGALVQAICAKDTLLRELQHRVKNNLQMITALIRLEARNVSNTSDHERFDRLSGRVEALGLLYQTLSDEGQAAEVDLGVYLSQVASAVMKAHAVEGIRLELKVDTWPVSVNVAMPAGLVVNELMTNALKHAFKGREGGTIQLHSVIDDIGCKVVVSDDGVGLPSETAWPMPGKLSDLIVKSLRENARANIRVASTPGAGTSVTIQFTRVAAAKE